MPAETGLLAGYLDAESLENLPAANDFDVPDGTYEFEVGDYFIKKGWGGDDDARALLIEYLVEGEDADGNDVDGKKYTDWFTLPDPDQDPSTYDTKQKRTLRNMVDRLAEFGYDRTEISTIKPEDIVGVTGTITLKTRAGTGAYKGRNFQNVTSLTIDEAPKPAAAPARGRRAAQAEPEDEPEEEQPEFKSRRRSARA